ncbi:MAG: hypothetical protein MUE60_16755, partial [Candidatus Eisenbacteria bacterium]|nr:hypothetical protein [Candidatus Eisenbacteria bacterium]
MLLIAVLLVAAALQPLDPGEPAETVGVQTMPSGSIEPASDDTLLSPPDSVRLPGRAEPRPGKVEGAPAQHGPAWPDTVYLRSGQTLVGRVLRTPGGKITMEVPSLTHGAPSYRVRFDRRQVLRIGRRRSVLDVPAGDPVRPQWSVHFGAYSEGQRVLSYPRICAEIGYARVQSDLGELERAIQHLYDTNATLRGHGLDAGVFKRETHGLALGVLTRFSPRL